MCFPNAESENVVAFTVTHGESQTYELGQRLLFPNIITNEGGGYSPSQNEFLCPFTGLYLFTASSARYMSTSQKDAIVEIVMDDTSLVTVFGATSSNSASSNVVLVNCQSGSRVYVQCGPVYDCYIRGDGNGWSDVTTFSGLLIAEDD